VLASIAESGQSEAKFGVLSIHVVVNCLADAISLIPTDEPVDDGNLVFCAFFSAWRILALHNVGEEKDSGSLAISASPTGKLSNVGKGVRRFVNDDHSRRGVVNSAAKARRGDNPSATSILPFLKDIGLFRRQFRMPHGDRNPRILQGIVETLARFHFLDKNDSSFFRLELNLGCLNTVDQSFQETIRRDPLKLKPDQINGIHNRMVRLLEVGPARGLSNNAQAFQVEPRNKLQLHGWGACRSQQHKQRHRLQLEYHTSNVSERFVSIILVTSVKFFRLANLGH
jgi:hypothetical protein